MTTLLIARCEPSFGVLEESLAKRQANRGSDGVDGGMEEAALGFAEDLGRLLGTAEKKANHWLQQRSEVTKQLTELRDKATQLLERLGGGDARFPGTGRKSATGHGPGRPPGSTKQATAGGKRKGMSAAARKAVGERMRKYWAARRKAEKTA